jgi:hypothetical protein
MTDPTRAPPLAGRDKGDGEMYTFWLPVGYLIRVETVKRIVLLQKGFMVRYLFVEQASP